MINFIVVESNDLFLQQLNDEICKIMLDYNILYEIHCFTEYSNQFKILTKLDIENKIYILDIRFENGLNIIENIRKRDLSSFIILINTLGINANRLLIFDTISQFDQWQERLKDTIDILVSYFLSNSNLILKKDGSTYSIPYKDILYINTHDRTSRIVSNSNVYEFRIQLNHLIDMLPKSFKKVSKSCVVNCDRVVYFHKTKKVIVFDDGSVLEIKKS